jgi:1-acyl-sn-glycerol-3-phosphate acyltransferase
VLGTLRIVLATLSIYLLAYPLTAFAVVLGCLAGFVRWSAFIRAATVAWGYLVFWLMGRRLRITGLANLAAGKAFLVVANHSSMFDVPALAAAVPGIAMMGRDYLARIPGLNVVLRILHFVPIDTASPRSVRVALSRAAGEIRRGQSVAIFAEGTRTRTGKVQALKRGFVSVLRESGGDVLPVYIRGTFALQPKGKRWVDPREPIAIRIGAPLAHARLAGLDDGQIMREVRATLVRMGEKRS